MEGKSEQSFLIGIFSGICITAILFHCFSESNQVKLTRGKIFIQGDTKYQCHPVEVKRWLKTEVINEDRT